MMSTLKDNLVATFQNLQRQIGHNTFQQFLLKEQETNLLKSINDVNNKLLMLEQDEINNKQEQPKPEEAKAGESNNEQK